jgi:hypothetical protein
MLTTAVQMKPQNTMEFLSVDLNNARRGLASYLINPDCANFIDNLLNTAARGDNPRVGSGGRDADILDVFDLARSRITRGIPANGGGGQATGSVAMNTAGVILAGTRFGRADYTANQKANSVLEGDIHTLLHELIHLSGVHGYGDYDLALAVATMTGTQLPEPTGRGSASDGLALSTFFDTELRKHCRDFKVKL